ncbi:hypothetical protein C9F11_10150 [Streptomyces sp. YIM 121038]|nr:hypothetical protein C9F11_10150 [Streptomyces sp. YIM 121038]
MRIDVIQGLVAYLKVVHGIPKDAPKGDMQRHTAGDTTVYLEHSGGLRLVRDRMDRIDVEYSVYAIDRKACIDLAMVVREAFLEDLPYTASAPLMTVLDVEEIAAPSYYPDDESREHMYGGEVAVYLTATD